ncbi:MAG: 50S ribosomal protein L13, partial [Planctomycetes bacterium]|nr:50S ribosomal protein L13 [Planctomycetota bacterium]
MPACKQRSYSAKTGEVERDWFLVDATDQILGRLASKIAWVLMGKHKPIYTRHVDCGDFVVVINAEKAIWTGNNKGKELSYRHTGWPG